MKRQRRPAGLPSQKETFSCLLWPNAQLCVSTPFSVCVAMLGLSCGLPGAVPLDLSHGSSQGSCQCWQQHGEDTAVFYNRVPKCGSTTMLR